MWSATAGIALAAAFLWAADPKTAVPDDPLLRAMRDEIARSKQLGLASLDAPYFIEYTVDDVQGFHVSATLGGLISSNRSQAKIPQVRVRVGDYDYDNTNYIYSDYHAGVRYDADQLPIDPSYNAFRRNFWLATDRAYKTALEAIGRKRAALKSVTQQEALPDFWKAPPVQHLQTVTRAPLDSARWTERVRNLSDVFSQYPEVLGSVVTFDGLQTIHSFINSEGAAVRTADPLFYVQIRAAGQAADGMAVRDAARFETADLARMPGEPELRNLAVRVADNVKALAAAPVGESYSGPVLVESEAAPQMIAELLGTQFSLPRKPVSEPGRTAPYLASDLEGRIGSRVLPDSMDVIDDPSMKQWNQIPLLGAYEIDDEGVKAQPVTLVEKGRLKGVLLTRQPVRGWEGSNGHARLPGAYGARTAVYSNLIVRTADGAANSELKKKFLEMVQQRGKPYGIIIRKMDYPSSASADDLRRIATASAQAGGGARPVSIPILAYRVYPDGREELVRGLRFRGLSSKSLRDIAATGSESTAFHFLYNLAPFSLLGAGGYVAPVSVIAPPMLFEDLDLERSREDMPKLPVVPPPALGS